MERAWALVLRRGRFTPTLERKGGFEGIGKISRWNLPAMWPNVKGFSVWTSPRTACNKLLLTAPIKIEKGELEQRKLELPASVRQSRGSEVWNLWSATWKWFFFHFHFVSPLKVYNLRVVHNAERGWFQARTASLEASAAGREAGDAATAGICHLKKTRLNNRGYNEEQTKYALHLHQVVSVNFHKNRWSQVKLDFGTVQAKAMGCHGGRRNSWRVENFLGYYFCETHFGLGKANLRFSQYFQGGEM